MTCFLTKGMLPLWFPMFPKIVHLVSNSTAFIPWFLERNRATSETYRQIQANRGNLGNYGCIPSYLILFLLYFFIHVFHFRNVTPVPMLPFFTFVVASVISLILGHIATVFHRRTLTVPLLPSIRNEVSKEAWGVW